MGLVFICQNIVDMTGGMNTKIYIRIIPLKGVDRYVDTQLWKMHVLVYDCLILLVVQVRIVRHLSHYLNTTIQWKLFNFG